MKQYAIYIGILILFISCKKKNNNPFVITLPHYSSEIEFEGVKSFDTLISWDWHNDNQMSDRRCYRIQNSKLGIVLENGMVPKRAEKLNQITIETPIKPNKFGKANISKWINETISLYSEEKPAFYKFPIVDSLLIDGRKFGVLSILKEPRDEKVNKVFYITNINDEEIVFEFENNLTEFDSLYKKSLIMMKSIKVKPVANNGYK